MLRLAVALLAAGSFPDAGLPLDGGSPPGERALLDGGFPPDGGDLVVDSSERDAGTLQEAQSSTPVVIRLTGEKVLPREVYLDTLHLPANARADDATAEEVRRQLTEFLHRTGYELATVEARADRGGIDVEVNEGQIERIRFFGQLTFQMVRFKLALVLAHDVFNRPLFERQLGALSEELGVSIVRWELVRVADVHHPGPQLESLPRPIAIAVQGSPVVRARRPYEVEIYFPEETYGAGPGIDLRSNYMDGLEGGLNYQGRGLFNPGDRWRAAASAGVGLRSRIDTEKLYARPSTAMTELRYDSLSIVRRWRPGAWLSADWLARQRADLNLEDYQALRVGVSGQLELELREDIHFLAGAGFEWRRLFGFTAAPDLELSADVAGNDRKRPFVRAAVDAMFSMDRERWDRRHGLEGEARFYLPVSQPGLSWLDLRYQRVWPIGWHDLWLKARGRHAWGDVTFHDELSLGEFTRGVFGTQFVPSAANVQLEYRFSISRDELKASLFHDLALFAVPLRERTGKVEPRLANAFGPGLHFLMQSLFQLDLYMAFGFTRGGRFESAFTAQLQKAF